MPPCRARRVPPLAVLLVALAVLAPTLHAHRDDGRPHVQAFQEIRDVRPTIDGSRVAFELTRPSEPLVDAIFFDFDGKTGIVRYEYRREAARAADAFAFSVTLDAILEYRDVNTNGRFDASADVTVREYPFKAMRWNLSETAPMYIGRDAADKKEARHVVANGTFGTTGEIRIQILSSGHRVDTGPARMHPQDVKMIWNIAHFPFTRDDTRMAIATHVVTAADARVTPELNADGIPQGVIIEEPGRMGFFDWADFAIGNSTGEAVARKPVFTRLHEGVPSATDPGAKQHLLVFSYTRTDFLLSHDPTVGLEYVPEGREPFLGLPVQWLLGLVGVAAVGGGGWHWYTRRDGRDRVRAWLDARARR